MDPYQFPQQKIVFSDKPFSGDFLAGVFADIFRASRPVTGYLRVAANDGTLYLLFLLQGAPYAAGRFTGHRPLNFTITEFFAETVSHPTAGLTVSFHETDPVLLKSMLVFLQDEPTIKAPVDIIDLEQIVKRIRTEAADSLIVLERDRLLNFYFFKAGKATFAHLADTSFSAPSDLSVDEQMLLYAFQENGVPVVAYVYRSVSTEKASDAEHLDKEALLAMVRGPAAWEEAPSPLVPTATITFVKGALKGERQTVNLPCSIGRKDCDLVINDGLVSRRHLLLHEVDGRLAITDQESTNGTLVNGEEVKRATLSPADIVTIGATSFSVSR